MNLESPDLAALGEAEGPQKHRQIVYNTVMVEEERDIEDDIDFKPDTSTKKFTIKRQYASGKISTEGKARRILRQ